MPLAEAARLTSNFFKVKKVKNINNGCFKAVKLVKNVLNRTYVVLMAVVLLLEN